MLVDSKIDFGDKRNLVISSVILVVGIGGAVIKVSDQFQIEGMALAAILGVLLNLILPGASNKQMKICLKKNDQKVNENSIRKTF